MLRATLVSWEYPLIGQTGVCVASMLVGKEGLEFGGIIHGPLASLIMAAAALAERDLGERRLHYHAKLIECPPLRLLLFMAQAPHGPSAVIPLISGTMAEETNLAISWGLRRCLVARRAATPDA